MSAGKSRYITDSSYASSPLSMRTWETRSGSYQNCPSNHPRQPNKLGHRTGSNNTCSQIRYQTCQCQSSLPQQDTVWQPQQDLDPQLDWPTAVEPEQAPLPALMYPTISPVRRSSRCNMVVTSRFKDYDVSNLHTHEGKCDSCAQRESTGNNTQLTKLSVALVISTHRVLPTNPTHIKPTTLLGPSPFITDHIMVLGICMSSSAPPKSPPQSLLQRRSESS